VMDRSHPDFYKELREIDAFIEKAESATAQELDNEARLLGILKLQELIETRNRYEQMLERSAD
jgi:hypothetical protein